MEKNPTRLPPTYCNKEVITPFYLASSVVVTLFYSTLLRCQNNIDHKHLCSHIWPVTDTLYLTQRFYTLQPLIGPTLLACRLCSTL